MKKVLVLSMIGIAAVVANKGALSLQAVDDTPATVVDDYTTPTPYDDVDYTVVDNTVPPTNTDETVTDADLPEDEEEDNLVGVVRVEIDKNLVRNFIKDSKAFARGEAVTHIVDAKKDVIRETANFYRNTAAKIAISFGKHFGPVLESIGQVAPYVSVDEETCDETCVSACFRPDRLLKGRVDIFNTECLAECGCALKLDKLNETEAQVASQRF